MIDLIIGLAALGFMTVVFFIGSFTIAGEEQEEQHDHLQKIILAALLVAFIIWAVLTM